MWANPAAAGRIAVLLFILNFGITSVKELKGISSEPIKQYEINRRQESSINDSTSTEPVTRPKLSLEFNPNYGYDPYWPGGQWVFQKLQSTTEKQEGTLCGNVCPDLYKDYGIICGRNINYTYRNFNNYCDLVNYDCKGGEKWMVVYRGKCRNFIQYPTKSKDILSRASRFIYEFDQRLFTTESPPPSPSTQNGRK